MDFLCSAQQRNRKHCNINTAQHQEWTERAYNVNENLSHETYSIYLNAQFPPPPPSQALSCVADIYGNLRSKNFSALVIMWKRHWKTSLMQRTKPYTYQNHTGPWPAQTEVGTPFRWCSINICCRESEHGPVFLGEKTKPLSVFGNQTSVNPVSKMPILSGEICK